MTDKEVAKLKRAELLEILIGMRKELDRLTAENKELRQRVEQAEANSEMIEKIYNKVCSGEKVIKDE